MLQIFNITVPIFLIIGLGYGAVRFGVFRFEELRGTAKFVMKVGLPALVFFAIAAKPVNEVFDAVYLATPVRIADRAGCSGSRGPSRSPRG